MPPNSRNDWAELLVVLVAFLAALAAGRCRTLRVVGKVVGVFVLAAAHLLLRHALLAFGFFIGTGGMLVLAGHVFRPDVESEMNGEGPRWFRRYRAGGEWADGQEGARTMG